MTRSIGRTLLPFALLAAAAALMNPAAAAGQTFDAITAPADPDAARVVWRIDRPNPRRRLTSYPQIRVRKGDVVRINAAGCVDRGGFRDTQYRYVDPRGGRFDASHGFYGGTIAIPGTTPGGMLVRIGAVVGHTLVASRGAYLRLGYEDNDYSDNGYASLPAGGVDGQCRGQRPAFVVISIDRERSGVTRTLGRPGARGNRAMDLVWSAEDDNGLPLDPRWHVQDRTRRPADVRAHCGFDYINDMHDNKNDNVARCSTQRPTIDDDYARCAGQHLSWFAATYQGRLRFSDYGLADPDISFDLSPRDRVSGLTTDSEGVLHTEMAQDETIDRFGTAYWKRLFDTVGFHLLPHRAPDGETIFTYGRKNEKGNDLIGDDRRAIVMGQVDVDIHTGGRTTYGVELHPIFALAVRLDRRINRERDRWVVLLRNSGSMGVCGSKERHLELRTLRLRLPAPRGATGVEAVFTEFRAGSHRASGETVRRHVEQGVYRVLAPEFVPGGEGRLPGALLTAALPSSRWGGYIEGELHLRWTGVPADAADGPDDGIGQQASGLQVIGGALPRLRLRGEDDKLDEALTAQQRQLLRSFARKRSPLPAPHSVALELARGALTADHDDASEGHDEGPLVPVGLVDDGVRFRKAACEAFQQRVPGRDAEYCRPR